MKIIFIILLCSMIILIGFKLSNQYVLKHRFFRSLGDMLQEFKLSISYKKDKIINILDRFNDKKELKQFIKCYKHYLTNGELDFNQVKEVDNEDINYLVNLTTSLGRYDIDTEIKQIDGFIERIKLKEKQVDNDKSK